MFELNKFYLKNLKRKKDKRGERNFIIKYKLFLWKVNFLFLYEFPFYILYSLEISQINFYIEYVLRKAMEIQEWKDVEGHKLRMTGLPSAWKCVRKIAVCIFVRDRNCRGARNSS